MDLISHVNEVECGTYIVALKLFLSPVCLPIHNAECKAQDSHENKWSGCCMQGRYRDRVGK